MIRAAATAIVLSFPLSTMSADVSAQEASLQQCQKWHSQIERYTDLRRSGGRAQQMDKWKRQRNISERKFKDGSCRKYGRKARE